ncbi:DUF2553 family protein [Risungbinella massiliensis]|uniref:DUF2553 family protein n=1 Tax=Risungbinella massiliensis TaxID=1329796 RepID=UPI0005CC69C2|nr:DUF2553 family protein [Risungbinella massiliensis]
MENNEANNQQKWNITRKVTAKMESGNMVFYHNNQAIGKMSMGGEGGLEMYDGYMMENESIYSLGEYIPHQDYYAHNCDMGWC